MYQWKSSYFSSNSSRIGVFVGIIVVVLMLTIIFITIDHEHQPAPSKPAAAAGGSPDRHAATTQRSLRRWQWRVAAVGDYVAMVVVVAELKLQVPVNIERGSRRFVLAVAETAVVSAEVATSSTRIEFAGMTVMNVGITALVIIDLDIIEMAPKRARQRSWH